MNTGVRTPLPDPAFSSFTTRFQFLSFTSICPFSSEVSALLCLLDSCSLSYSTRPSPSQASDGVTVVAPLCALRRAAAGDMGMTAAGPCGGQSQLRKHSLPSSLQPRCHPPLLPTSPLPPSVSPLSLSFIPYSTLILSVRKRDSGPCALRPLHGTGCVDLRFVHQCGRPDHL